MKMRYIFFMNILFAGLALANLARPNNNINHTDHTTNEEGDFDIENDFLDNPLTETDDQSSSAVGRFLFKKETCSKIDL